MATDSEANRLIEAIRREAFEAGRVQGVKEGIALVNSRFKDLMVELRAPSAVANQPADPIATEAGIEILNLRVDTYNLLMREGVTSIELLLGKTADELLDIKRFGRVSLSDVRIALARIGYSLLGEGGPTTPAEPKRDPFTYSHWYGPSGDGEGDEE